MNDSERSYLPIDFNDLSRLAEIAKQDRISFFTAYPKWRNLYGNRLLCVTLCQGAALHYVDGKNGVKDFDVWTFYAENKEAQFPPRRRKAEDFGASKFGRWPGDRLHYTGRRVDLIGRSLPVNPDANPIEAVRAYLRMGQTNTARELAKKAVVIIEPEDLIGIVIWP